MEQTNKTKNRLKIALLIVIVLISALLAGITGELFARVYLSQLAFFRDFYFTQGSDFAQKEIVINEPKKVVVQQDLMANQVMNDIKSSVLGIYKMKRISKNLLDNAFLPDDYLGQAAILTSDGWLISTSDAVNRSAADLTVSYDKKNYDVVKIVRDSATDIVFLKIDAQNLPVIKFADFSALTIGQQVLTYNSYADQLDLANILDKRYKAIYDKYDLVSSSQILDKYILLNRDFSSDLQGAPIFNFNGELVGLLVGPDKIYNKVIPIYYIYPVINQVLKSEPIKRPYLGINYINLSQVYGLSDEDRQGLDFGALLWSDSKGQAVNSDSPLFSKLVKGDIITTIENQTIGQDKDLLETLLDYKVGQEIRLVYLHNKKEATLSVILK